MLLGKPSKNHLQLAERIKTFRSYPLLLDSIPFIMLKSIFRVKPIHARLFSSEIGTPATATSNWAPKKRVSRPTMEKIRALAASQPGVYNTVTLSTEFKLSVEAVRRILKSNYVPKEQDAERQETNRYKAMGERRTELKKTYNIPESKPKTIGNKQAASKERSFSFGREEQGKKNMWSNDVYKKRHFGKNTGRYNADEDSRAQNYFDNNGPNNQPRQNSYRRNDQSEQKPFRGGPKRNYDQRQPFRKGGNNGNDGERKSYREYGFNATDKRERKPFRRFTNEDRPFNDKRSFQRRDSNQDATKRSFNRKRDNNNEAADRRFPSYKGGSD
ncbi:hypothetical protein [Parasitella parasitica]|uniref:Required for respiratory growth protein 9, mitochondrial n=1 Tax=Parasitella parasitica TaxID=35722 RepID=A0A0B7N7C5_9FUNG|nr:hypothetical protein [Parasitella parasitica]